MAKRSKRWKGSQASRIADDRRYIEEMYRKNQSQIELGYSEYVNSFASGGLALNAPPSAKQAFVNAMMNRLHPELQTINKDKSLSKSEKISKSAAAKRERSSATERKSALSSILNSSQFSTWESTEGHFILRKLKEHGVYEEFRKKIGKTKKIDFSKLKRINGTNAYRYDYRFKGEDRSIGIKFTASPEVVRLIDM